VGTLRRSCALPWLLPAAVAALGWWLIRQPQALPAATVAIGGLTTGMLVVTGWRGQGAARASWCGVALGCALWAASLFGALRGWDSWWVWVGLRVPATLSVGIGLIVAPGVRRGRREWGLLLMDGWLVGGSTLVISWVGMGLSGLRSPTALAHLAPGLCWAPFDLVAGTVIAGLGVRAAERHRRPVAAVGAAALLAGIADASWGVTGDEALGVVLWLVMMAFLASATITRTVDIWAGSAPASHSLPLARLSHLAVVPGLLAAAVASPPDAVSVGLAAGLLLVLSAQILLSTRQARTLWTRAREQTHRLDTVLRESRDAIMQLSADGTVEFANPACAEVLGHDPATLIGRQLATLAHPEDLHLVVDRVTALDHADGALRLISRFVRADGSWRHLESTVSRRAGIGPQGLTMLARDVEDRIELEARLRRQAATDALTGLYNRQAFLAELEARLANGSATVLFCDLDGFKAVNDTEGHAVGDALLQQAAKTILAATTAGSDLVARLGGDEFAVLVPTLPRGQSLAETLVGALGRSRVDGLVGVSVGLATGAAITAEELLGDADLAMYEAKAHGRGCWIGFEPSMRERVLERSRMRADLERAIESGGLSLDLQPIVEVSSGEWHGFEALVRWHDGDTRRGPGEFLPLAEETGLIVPLGAWVLGAALRWLAAWPDQDAGISVNVAGGQVADPGFADLVRTQLRQTRVAPSRLTLEITEQTAVEDLTRAGAVLQPLRQLGVHVSLDDFGTGFSSLGYLAQLPVDELKIDQKFVSGLGRRPEDDVLVRTVLRLAADLGLRVVAEGVETPWQAEILRAAGCPLVQGYLYSRPVPAGTLRPRRATGSVPRPAGPPAVESSGAACEQAAMDGDLSGTSRKAQSADRI
jgi:diguanylate cyclase (GGDEF)-like protein/PAS domain S-box-containing protein